MEWVAQQLFSEPVDRNGPLDCIIELRCIWNEKETTMTFLVLFRNSYQRRIVEIAN